MLLGGETQKDEVALKENMHWHNSIYFRRYIFLIDGEILMNSICGGNEYALKAKMKYARFGFSEVFILFSIFMNW